MSYTVLARKWRPKNFSELVGQTHVMQALANALDQQRLHHAYLFTGTRGVGKTTIARIFAKALNCEQGISSTPCGQCSVCKSIDEGRFVDLIEVDAASRTKVEDTREILDNVQYAPTQGRYKVYLIDEVHMLSKSSFNALLKTLEEPPEHVKFLLATTDPHKLPITVLSRCLQFNLLRLTSTQIQNHLAHILQQEQIDFEPTALALIAKSADGSARDSLSLLDQAIAYCGGKIQFEAVRSMLGLVDQGVVQAILQALSDDSAEQVKQILQTLASLGVDYVALVNQLLEVLHQTAQTQILGEALEDGLLPTDILADFANCLSPAKVQLLYQIGLLARQDMKLAPDVRIGFEMTLLRMLAFDPSSSGSASSSGQAGLQNTVPTATPNSNPVQASAGGRQSVAELLKAAQVNETPANFQVTPQTTQASEPVAPNQPEPSRAQPVADLSLFPDLQARVQAPNVATSAVSAPIKTPAVAEPEPAPLTNNSILNAIAPTSENIASLQTQVQPEPMQAVASQVSNQTDWMPQAEESADQILNNQTTQTPDSALMSTRPGGLNTSSQSQPVQAWMDLIQQLGLDGMALELARQCVLVDANHQAWWLSVHPDEMHAKTDLAVTRLEQAAQRQFGEGFKVNFIEFTGEFYTPNLYDKDQQTLSQEQAAQSIFADENVHMLQERLGMQVLEKSIQPL
ncbi:MAG: DNA polymerase III subunit gamma/tau [Thiomicrospira sp.]|uniref:DNA polymerase III subunit gamma/tau n=1 Tax=Thiomicrospira sp. TaxID=935 RepID=UPI0019F25C8F|nr:DNA polymerase III subunit gamma/tau [Thiomicrospira sp.]MBE0493798.1 DNA polymerase III subunit gamma/tau [Thiomicrospira sp.]